MRRLIIWQGRWRLHKWLNELIAAGIDPGIRPCLYSSKMTCDCHFLALRSIRVSTMGPWRDS